MLKIINMVKMQNFEVMFNNFQTVEILHRR